MTTNRESTDDKQETTHNYDTYTHTHTPIQIRSSDDWRTAPNTFIIERYRDTFTPADCGRATNQVHRPKVKREKIQVPKCIRLIDKTRQDARKKEKHKADRNCLSSRPRLKAHTRGHPCRECWRQAGRARPLIRHAPGACHQQGISRPHPSLAVQGATVLRAGLFRRGASPLSPAFLFRLSLLAPIVISIAMPAPVLGGGRVSDAGANGARGAAPSESDI